MSLCAVPRDATFPATAVEVLPCCLFAWPVSMAVALLFSFSALQLAGTVLVRPSFEILDGTETMTVYKPLGSQAYPAAEAAVAWAKGASVKSTAVLWIESKSIPAVLLRPVVVTKDNIRQTVIQDGFQNLETIQKLAKGKVAPLDSDRRGGRLIISDPRTWHLASVVRILRPRLHGRARPPRPPPCGPFPGGSAGRVCAAGGPLPLPPCSRNG